MNDNNEKDWERNTYVMPMYEDWGFNLPPRPELDVLPKPMMRDEESSPSREVLTTTTTTTKDLLDIPTVYPDYLNTSLVLGTDKNYELDSLFIVTGYGIITYKDVLESPLSYETYLKSNGGYLFYGRFLTNGIVATNINASRITNATFTSGISSSFVTSEWTNEDNRRFELRRQLEKLYCEGRKSYDRKPNIFHRLYDWITGHHGEQRSLRW